VLQPLRITFCFLRRLVQAGFNVANYCPGRPDICTKEPAGRRKFPTLHRPFDTHDMTLEQMSEPFFGDHRARL
jgi:hypothetical protein